MFWCTQAGSILLVNRVAIPPSLVRNEATTLHLIILIFLFFIFNFFIFPSRSVVKELVCTETLSNAKLDATTVVQLNLQYLQSIVKACASDFELIFSMVRTGCKYYYSNSTCITSASTSHQSKQIMKFIADKTLLLYIGFVHNVLKCVLKSLHLP